MTEQELAKTRNSYISKIGVLIKDEISTLISNQVDPKDYYAYLACLIAALDSLKISTTSYVYRSSRSHGITHEQAFDDIMGSTSNSNIQVLNMIMSEINSINQSIINDEIR